MTLNFQELLVVFSVLIFAVTLYLIFKSRKNFEENKIERIQVLHSPVFSKVLYRIHYFFLLLFIIVTGYSIWFGLRPFLYYFVFALLFLTSVFLVLASAPGKRVLATRTVLITVIILSLTQSMLPTFENRFIIFGSDQWRDIVATKLISEQGNFSSAAAYSGSYYSSIPLFSVLNAVVTLITGNVFLSFAILTGAMSLVMVLAIYFILLKLARSQIASVVGVFVFLSTPRLALIQVLPSTVSLVLGSVLILLLIEYVSIPCRRTLAALVLVAFSALIFHPTGIIVLIILCGGLVIIHLTGVARQAYPQSKMARNLLGVVCIMAFAYWSLNYVIFTSIITPLKTLLSSIPTSLGPSIYTPRYLTSGFEVFSYAWAVPAGISAAYVVATLYKLLRGRKDSRATSRETLSILPFTAGMIGLLLIVVGFISIIHAPSASVERYVDNTAYLLLAVSSAVVSSQLIGSRQKLAVVCMIFLLGASVYIGSGCPDWAPFENPTFGAIRDTYTGYVEANTIVKHLPNNITIYADYDIPVDGVAAMADISFSMPGTFQIIRNVLATIKDGTFNPFVPIYANSPATFASVNATFIVKLDEVQNTTAIDEYMNILYNSGMHIVLRNP
jgi:hypothetical protein